MIQSLTKVEEAPQLFLFYLQIFLLVYSPWFIAKKKNKRLYERKIFGFDGFGKVPTGWSVEAMAVHQKDQAPAVHQKVQVLDRSLTDPPKVLRKVFIARSLRRWITSNHSLVISIPDLSVQCNSYSP